jgi:hypothetical protein
LMSQESHTSLFIILSLSEAFKTLLLAHQPQDSGKSALSFRREGGGPPTACNAIQTNIPRNNRGVTSQLSTGLSVLAARRPDDQHRPCWN